ncbi:hypothetical protein [Rufibacter latericius]|uniref:Uncharacterized protein n=1 Tax=Rufibacter latericius TaxID=2487040 RepID=A0A3M9MZM6_9BACT|nr:hypothetical protein [Rufibacter latericius]RNI31012.1 hypothetical protein EFB08_00265 [Rufibacter latericius]
MKKLTFLAAAFLLAGTSFAQTTSSTGSQDTNSKTTHGTTVSTTAKTTLSADVNADVSGKGEAVREVAKAKADKAKEKKEKTDKALQEEITSQKEAAKARKEELRAQKEEAKAQKEATLDAAAQTKADLKAKTQTEETLDAASHTEVKVKSNAELKSVRKDQENHGEAVSTLTRETLATGKEKGELVKTAASEKRQRAGRVSATTGTAAKVNASTSARRTKVTTGLSTKGVKPVKVNAAANLKVGK